MSTTPTSGEFYKKFLTSPLSHQEHELSTRPAAFWTEQGGAQALETFHHAATRVPAYKDFLHKHSVDHEKVQSLDDFQHVPPVHKKNYLREYPLHDLCWNGTLDGMNVISVSSGSTGKPFMWPRDIFQEHEVDHWYGLTYEHLFDVPHKRSLVLICFALGMYIAGPFTYASTLRYAQAGKPLTITTPSNDQAAALRIVQELANEYDQIILGGYPPLIKDLLEAGIREGINWKEKHTRLFFGGEGYSEQWREYVHGLIGADTFECATVNMYGTADAGLLGIETPFSVQFRKAASQDADFLKSQFLDERLPSVLTYNPLLKFFEVADERKLLFTSSSGVPVVRYDIGDQGGIISYDHAHAALTEHGYSSTGPQWNLPLVYLFGRSDFTVHLYGANVYPENIKQALEHKSLQEYVSGKFILTTEHREDMTPYLHLRVQLRSGVEHSAHLAQKIQDSVVQSLRTYNSEYEVIYTTIGESARPEITLDSFRNPDYQINIKHRWVRN